MKTAKIAVLLALALMLLAAVPVSAGAPEVITGTDDIDYAEPEGFCPGFEVRNHEIYSYRIKTWFDDEGNVLRSEAYYEGVDNLYNPGNPGVVVSGHFVASGHYDARTGKDYITGVPYSYGPADGYRPSTPWGTLRAKTPF
jgi:hypothetical protein